MISTLPRRALRQVRPYSVSTAPTNSSDTPVYLIVGATGGIGSSLANYLSACSARLVLAGRSEEKLSALRQSLPNPEDCVEETFEFGGDTSSLESVVQRSASHFGRIDGVAHLMGSLLLKSAHTTSTADFRTHLDVNLVSAFAVLRQACPLLAKNGGGSIVLCSSGAANIGLQNHETVSAAKAGVQGLALAAAATYAKSKVRINCIAPGLTRTPLTSRLTGSAQAIAASERLHALQRIGEADEVAEAIAFLMHSKSSAWITGQVLGVDGGLSSIK